MFWHHRCLNGCDDRTRFCIDHGKKWRATTEARRQRGPTMSTSAANEFEKISCPKCGEQIPISEALQRQLAARTEAKVRAEVERHEATLATTEGELKKR